MNETLYVSGWTAEGPSAWAKSGASPYLSDDAAFIYHDVARDEKYWTFANSAVGAGTINSVVLYLQSRSSAEPQVHVITAYLNVGAADVNVGTIDPTTTGYLWYTIDVSATVDSWAKIDACALRLAQTAIIDHYNYVQRAYLYIDYTAAGAGQQLFTLINEMGYD